MVFYSFETFSDLLILPKTLMKSRMSKFHGKKRTTIAVAITLLKFSVGKESLITAFSNMGMNILDEQYLKDCDTPRNKERETEKAAATSRFSFIY